MKRCECASLEVLAKPLHFLADYSCHRTSFVLHWADILPSNVQIEDQETLHNPVPCRKSQSMENGRRRSCSVLVFLPLLRPSDNRLRVTGPPNIVSVLGSHP